MKRMGYLPVTPGDFSRREAAGEKQWNKVSQKLQRLTLSADSLQAMVNGLRRILKDSQKYGVNADAASRQRFQTEVEANERDLARYRKQIKAYRQALEMGRSQIGFGDQRFVVDDRVRAEFRKLFSREVQLAAAGQGGSSAQSYARSIQSLVSRADTVEAQLEATRSKLEKQVESKASDLKKKIDREAAALRKYTAQLGGLDDEARVLVGEVAKKNFAKVRDRLKSVVLRADVGVVQQAWEVREEAKRRVIGLQRERAREEQNLNDELREVLDDAGEDQ